ncbi:MAG: 50S ribosomal protein L13 [Methanosarcinales archaeon]|nr:50S ribosomal protein L13 [Methanosarcinales archaeon]HUV79962.1 50S ribosomal protein L13 [Candidatus Bathyarchaeia archaeon]
MGVEIIDGEGLILGRLASAVAKKLLTEKDTEIVIVNAERVVISGSKERTFKDYKAKKDRGSKEQGPFFPKMPDRIVKRTIRGMLPYKQAKGRDAFSRLKVYLSIPDEYESAERGKVESASAERLSRKYVTVGKVSEKLGWVQKQR